MRQNLKQHIEELVTEYCTSHGGDNYTLAARYWNENPTLYDQYIKACGEAAARALPLRIQANLSAAAYDEDPSDTNIEQLTLPGIPAARLSPLVEVAAGDWRRQDDVSMYAQIQHSDSMEEKARRKASYQKQKGRDQRLAAEAMERRVPGSADLPYRAVIEQWREMGLFDDAPIETTTHQATT